MEQRCQDCINATPKKFENMKAYVCKLDGHMALKGEYCHNKKFEEKQSDKSK